MYRVRELFQFEERSFHARYYASYVYNAEFYQCVFPGTAATLGVLATGLATNVKWLHSIRQATNINEEAEEVAFNGERISLTFQHIGTFFSKDLSLIWRQGAKGKTKEKAGHVVRNGEEAENPIIAFGEENHNSDFDWNAAYGQEFNVLHFS